MTTDVLEVPVSVEAPTNEPILTHIISREDEMLGYIYGKEVTALCGHRFVPTRDPQKFPVCQPCKQVLSDMIRAFGKI